jgi:hypothetical protein
MLFTGHTWGKRKFRARCWCLMPVTLATQGAEFRKITVRIQKDDDYIHSYTHKYIYTHTYIYTHIHVHMNKKLQ